MSRLVAPPPRTPKAFVAVAALVAGAAQIGFVEIFAEGERPVARADLEAPKDEMAVAVDAVDDRPLLKYGSEHPSSASKRSSSRARPSRGAAAPARPTPVPTPGATAEPLPEPTETPQAPDPQSAPTTAPTTAPTDLVPEVPESADTTASAADAGPPAAATTQGSALGSDAGTEVDPLKARAAASYRAQLDNWFSARFHIRGKLPFDRLQKLAASVVVNVADRHVVSFSLSSPSGDPIFDGQLRSDLNAIQSSGVELPAPPPTHPELLGPTVSLRFSCAVRAYCE